MRSSVVTTPPRVAAGQRLPHLRTLSFLVAQVVLVAALLWFCLPQALGGRAGWVLVSGTSMLPHLHSGDLVLVEHRSSYHAGEVVAYRVPKGQVGAGFVVIHRIIGGNGRTGWRMKGDNRTAPDLWSPTNRDVVGSKLLRIPHAWLVLRFFHSPLLLALAAGLGAFVLIALRGDAKPDGEESKGIEPR
jgi:signal peptidase